MNKLKFIMTVSALFLSFAQTKEAEAQVPKVDVANSGGGIFHTVSTVVDDAHEKLKSAEKWVNEKVLGPALDELNSFRDSVGGELKDLKKEYDEGVGKDIKKAKEDAEKAVADAKKAATDTVDGLAGGAAEAITGAVGDVNIGDNYIDGLQKKYGVGADASDMRELANLNIQKAKIDAEYLIKQTAKEQYYDALISALTKSMSEAQEKLNVPGVTDNDTLKYQSSVNSLTNEKNKLETEKTNDIFGINKEKDEKLREIEAKIAELKLKVTKSLKDKATAAAKEKGKEYWGGLDTKAGMEEIEKEGFIGKDEQENQETVSRIVTQRRKMALDEIMNAVVVGSFAQTILAQSDEKVEKMADQGTALEGLNAHVLMDMNVKIEELRALLEYNKVLLSEMKLKTSNSLVRIDVYKFEEKHGDITKFNLDDYDFENQCKLVGSMK